MEANYKQEEDPQEEEKQNPDFFARVQNMEQQPQALDQQRLDDTLEVSIESYRFSLDLRYDRRRRATHGRPRTRSRPQSSLDYNRRWASRRRRVSKGHRERPHHAREGGHRFWNRSRELQGGPDRARGLNAHEAAEGCRASLTRIQRALLLSGDIVPLDHQWLARRAAS